MKHRDGLFRFIFPDAVLFSRERPDLIVNIPRSSRQWGIWNGKAHLIPDPIEEIRTTGNG